MTVSKLIMTVCLIGVSVSVTGIVQQKVSASTTPAQEGILSKKAMQATQGRGYVCNVDNNCGGTFVGCENFAYFWYTRSKKIYYNPGKTWSSSSDPNSSETNPTTDTWCQKTDYYYEKDCNNYKDTQQTTQTVCAQTATVPPPGVGF